LTSLLREALDAVLPREVASWVWIARAERVRWKREGIAMAARKPRLLRALNRLYTTTTEADAVEPRVRIPWLSAPEDSWL
jgi:uroporphyrin-III C-methyltransferase/precorrin-2 dehydrogenase/sirohydrochlorin ferrochelatase